MGSPELRLPLTRECITVIPWPANVRVAASVGQKMSQTRELARHKKCKFKTLTRVSKLPFRWGR